MARHRLLRPTRRRVTAATLAAVGTITAVAALSPDARAAETVVLPSSGSVHVLGHGNGHGHGLSQWGAQGAALQGLSATQILAFYYQHTTPKTLTDNPQIRVAISGAGTTTVTRAKNLVSGGTSVNLDATARYRLVPSGSNLQLQKSTTSGWQAQPAVLGPQADFSTTSDSYVRLVMSDGTYTDYRGTVGALRSGTSEVTINRLALDLYVQGVVPRESPSYWADAALQAQAVAARSYARYEAEHTSNPWDICDTTSCQVYGGYAHYASDGTTRLYGEEDSTNNAVAATANQVLTYNTATIFAQFSASDGGWTVDGGQPYLLARSDPYDTAAIGDPWADWSRDVPVSSIAAAYGLKRVDRIEITQRDGNGQWGGRVLAGYVDGVTSSGASAHIATTGFELQDAMNLPHHWFSIQSVGLPPTTGGTTVSSTGSSVTMIYPTASGGLTAHSYVNGSGWAAPVALGAPSGGRTWDPDAASYGSGHIDLVTRNGTGHLAVRAYDPGSGWSPWHIHPDVLASSPAVADAAAGDVVVLYRGSSNTLWTTRWTSGAGWTAPAAIRGVTNVASGPDAFGVVSRRTVTAVYRGTDGRLWSVGRSASGAWGTPAVVNPTHPLPVAAAAADPTATDNGSGALSVYYTGTDGLIRHSAYNPSTKVWSSWIAVPGSDGTTSAPEASNEGPNHVDLVFGVSGQLRSTSWNAGAGWRTPSPLF